MEMIESFKTFQSERFSRGYGMIGFENLINDLSSENLEKVKKSLRQLTDELKNANMTQKALNLGILEQLKILIVSDSADISILTIKLLNLISKSFQGSQVIARDEELMRSILTHFPCQLEACAELLQALSENPLASRNLVNSKYFIAELVKLIHTTSNEKFLSVLSNFIAIKPELFVGIEILESLLKNINKSNDLKCLALLLNCDDCQQLASGMKIEHSLLDVLLHDECVEEVKTYAIMAMRNCLTFKNICNEEFPWRRLLAILVEGTKTKVNGLLQELCIQTIRVMSDSNIVKDYLRKDLLDKLRKISVLTDRSKIMKKDLLDWLSYRNYKVGSDSNSNYSKLFV